MTLPPDDYQHAYAYALGKSSPSQEEWQAMQLAFSRFVIQEQGDILTEQERHLAYEYFILKLVEQSGALTETQIHGCVKELDGMITNAAMLKLMGRGLVEWSNGNNAGQLVFRLTGAGKDAAEALGADA